MYKYLLPILTLVLSTSAYGQDSFRKNDIYVEFFGNGIASSLNYERQLMKQPGLGVRLGVGYFSGDEKFRLSIPIGVNYLFNLRTIDLFLMQALAALGQRLLV